MSTPLVTRYVRVLGGLLVLQAVTGSALKLGQGRGGDLPHTTLHLLSGLLALVVTSRAARAPAARAPAARRFAVGFGVLYVALAVVGSLQASAVGILHLELADHVFHVVVGLVTLAVGFQGLRTAADPDRQTVRTWP